MLLLFVALLPITGLGLTGAHAAQAEAVSIGGKPKLVVTQTDLTIMKAEKVLRYDFTIKNIGRKTLQPQFDYPGHHYYPIEVAVRPGKQLKRYMVMDEHTKYRKMAFKGSGSGGLLDPGREVHFYVEYRIQEDADLSKVLENARDGVLLVLDGPKVVAEFPLQDAEGKKQ